MAQSGNCIGNFIITFIGLIINSIWMYFAGFLAIFGLWQLGIDVEWAIVAGLAPTDFLAEGGAVELMEMPYMGVTSCSDDSIEACTW